MKKESFAFEDNPLKDVRVEIPKEPVLKNALDELMKGISYETPAEKNFKKAERQLPTSKKQIW